VPIVQWIDRTSITGNSRFSLKPPCSRLPFLKNRFAALIKHGDIAGFCPKPKTSSAQNKSDKQGYTIHNYHAQLHAVLQSNNGHKNRKSILRTAAVPWVYKHSTHTVTPYLVQIRPHET
jgi:hypothetical protein